MIITVSWETALTRIVNCGLGSLLSTLALQNTGLMLARSSLWLLLEEKQVLCAFLVFLEDLSLPSADGYLESAPPSNA